MGSSSNKHFENQMNNILYLMDARHCATLTIMTSVITNSSTTSRRTSTWAGLRKIAWMALMIITVWPFSPYPLLWFLLAVMHFNDVLALFLTINTSLTQED